MKKVSPWLKKCPKWGPQKGVRGCQRTAFEGPFSIPDPGRSSQTSQDLSKTSQAPILELFRCSFQYVVHVPVGQNGTEYIAGVKMPRKNWREFRPCILLFLLIFSPQSNNRTEHARKNSESTVLLLLLDFLPHCTQQD